MNPQRRNSTWHTLLAIGALHACGGDTPAAPAPVATTIIVSPQATVLSAIDETQQFTAEVRDQNGSPMAGAAVTWSTSTAAVAAVDGSTGLATATGTGNATITARAGTASGNGAVTVRQEPRAIEKADGDDQTGVKGEPLPVSPAVRLLDANGHPAAEVQVTFAVTSGGGSVSPSTVRSSRDGTASTTWTLGPDSLQTMSAAAETLTAEFQAIATPAPLSVVTDSLSLARATLVYSAALVAKGGSTEGYAWSLGEGSTLPVGLHLEKDGTIRGTPTDAGSTQFDVRVTDSEGATASGSLSLRVCPGPLGLEIGDVEVILTDELPPCGFALSAPDAEAYYRITLAATSGYGEQLHRVALAVEDITPTPGPGRAHLHAHDGPDQHAPQLPPFDGLDGQNVLETELANEELHRRVRQHEAELYARFAAEGRLAEALARGPASVDRSGTQADHLPEQRTFRLYSQANGANRCVVDRTVAAKLIAENDHMGVYEESTAQSPVSVETANRVIDFYTDHGVEVIDRWFGGVSDVNGDGRIIVLIDPALDGIRAFVWSGDMTFSTADCATSNEMELVHMSAGAFDSFDDDRYWALAAMVHEVKHVSSLYKRVRGWQHRGGSSSDPIFHPTWIEEGTAEIAKEMASRFAWSRAGGPSVTSTITGDSLRAGLSDSRPEVYGVFGLMARVVRAFSIDPNAVTFVASDGGTVYGSGWHFHRFLRDWLANPAESLDDDERLVTALNDSLTVPRIPGITAITGRSINDLLLEHGVAMTVAGAEEHASEDTPHFASYIFPTATEIFSNPDPPGIYPWPITTTGADDASAVLASPLALTRTFRGQIGDSGIRIHDFRAGAAGATAVFGVEAPPLVRVIVARIPDPKTPSS